MVSLGIVGGLAAAGVPAEVLLGGIVALFVGGLIVKWIGGLGKVSHRSPMSRALRDEQERYNNDPEYRQKIDTLLGDE